MSTPSLGTNRTYGADVDSTMYDLGSSSFMCRSGDRYYLTYLDTSDRVRLVTAELDGTLVSDQVVMTGSGAENGAHESPAVWPRPSGGVRMVFPHLGQSAFNSEANGLAPRYRELPDPADPSSWSADGMGIPIRASAAFDSTWTNKTLSHQYDLQAVHDELSGRAYLVCEAAGFYPGGVPENGLIGVLTLFPEDGSVDGPYVLIHSANGQPPGAAAPGNIFVKSKLALGPSSVGPRPLFVFWETMNTFTNAMPGGGLTQWNHSIYCAVSRDGGHRWSNLVGAASFTKEAGVQWNDAFYLVSSTDHQQGDGHAAEVDPRTGYPRILTAELRAGSGFVDPPGSGHVDTIGSHPTLKGIWDLRLLSWNGAAWQKETIRAQSTSEFNTTGGDLLCRPRMAFFAPDRTEVLVNCINGIGGLEYRYREANAAAWSAATSIATGVLRWAAQYVDPARPNVLHLLYQIGSETVLHWRELTVGSAPAKPTRAWRQVRRPPRAWSAA